MAKTAWTRVVGVYIAATLGFVALVKIGGSLVQRQRGPAPAVEEYSRKLALERPTPKIPAPDFVLENASGQKVTLQSFRGKVVFLNFWATWCFPCRREMPTMEKIYRQFRDRGLEVAAVNYKENREEVQRFFSDLGLSFTSLLDPDGAVSDQYGAWSIPLSFFIDRKGDIVAKVVGYRIWDSPESSAFFSELLDEGLSQNVVR
ncbi:MAG: TlpA family protein disulfide reductase [Deltaproteobacteria bacterium]|nr:TlpA family protein disulfide reductase [Deltaproteobacteria bacterium]